MGQPRVSGYDPSYGPRAYVWALAYQLGCGESFPYGPGRGSQGPPPPTPPTSRHPTHATTKRGCCVTEFDYNTRITRATLHDDFTIPLPAPQGAPATAGTPSGMRTPRTAIFLTQICLWGQGERRPVDGDSDGQCGWGVERNGRGHSGSGTVGTWRRHHQQQQQQQQQQQSRGRRQQPTLTTHTPSALTTITRRCRAS